MLNKKHALVFMWDGNPICDEDVAKLLEFFVDKGYTKEQLIVAQYKDQSDIAAIMVREAGNRIVKTVQSIEENVQKNETTTAIRSAVEYIGKRFENSLANTKTLGSLTNFALTLQPEASKAYAKPESLRDYDETCLVNAIEILSTATGTIPASLAKKYHITRGVISIIKQIYNQFK